MKPSLNRHFIASASSCSILFLTGLMFFFSVIQPAHAARISIDLNGVLDTTVAGSSEPYVGVGDVYTGALQFDIDNTDQFSNISGDVTVRGVASNFASSPAPYSYVYGVAPSQIQIWFYFTPFGAGPGALNIEALSLTVETSAVNPFTTGLYELFTASDSVIKTIGFMGSVVTGTLTTHRYSNDIDPTAVIDQISVVPLPAGLPLYGAGLALLGFIGWHRKRKLTGELA